MWKQRAVKLLTISPWFIIPIVLILLIAWGYSIDGSGFNEHVGTIVQDNQYYQPARTFWDWMELLVVPLVLALGGFTLNRSQRSREQQTAADNLQETTLQQYLDQISTLLLDKSLRNSQPGSEVRDIARARTLITLRRIGKERKGILLKFLFEAELIGRDETKRIIDLRDADLRLIDLNGAIFNFVSLRGAVLNRANLQGSDLSGSELIRIFLQEADLSGSNLSYCDLSGADIANANLSSAELSLTMFERANLERSNLRNAICVKADLRKANLRGADLSGANLLGAMLEEADLVGTKYNRVTRFPERFIPSEHMRFIED